MDTLRKFVADLRVRRHFHAALTSRPVFRSGEELPANAAMAVSFHDVPAFDVTDWTNWVAVVGVRSETHFQKTEQRFVLRARCVCFRYEYDERQSARRIPRENRFEFARVFFHGTFGPERMEQVSEWRSIRRLRTSNPDTGVQNKPHRFFAFSSTS
jgi:hypothetical protein